MTARAFHWRRRSIGRPRAHTVLAMLAAAAIAASGCSTTRQTRYSLQEEPRVSSWATQTQGQAWMEIYTDRPAVTEQ